MEYEVTWGHIDILVVAVRRLYSTSGPQPCQPYQLYEAEVKRKYLTIRVTYVRTYVHTYLISNKRIISKATTWERRSDATFEGKKTMLIHFTRNDARLSNVTVNIKRQEVQSVTEVKLLGVVMNRELRYRNHMALAVTKGLKVAMALKRLQMTSPSMARQLFTCMVASVVNYAMIVWKHACNC